jgi:REP element-mobilizing transposase RayT
MEDRIVQLAQVFAVAVHGYALMSNHFHLVVEIDPGVPQRWSDEEVATRWLALSANANVADDELHTRIAQLAEHKERLIELRERLDSLSWFMKYLKEPITRRANREDACKGCCWEARFGSQALLDDLSILSSLVYVDLNPIRADIAQTPEQSVYTSVCTRIKQAKDGGDTPLRPLATSIQSELSFVTTEQYLELVDWTGRTLHLGKFGVIADDAPPILKRLGLRPSRWCLQVPCTENHYWRAIGQLETLMHAATQAGRKWLCGIGMARRLQRVSDTH